MKEYKLLIYNMLKGTTKDYIVWTDDVDSAIKTAKLGIAKLLYLENSIPNYTIAQYMKLLTTKEITVVKG